MDPVERDARLLDPLRGDEPHGPGRVDLARAIRAGRRRRRTRRAATIAAAAAATLAVFVPTTILAHLARSPAEPAAPLSTPAARLQEGGFDVMTRAFVVGSAGGFTPDRYETGRHRQVIELRSADPARRAGAVITMYAPGRYPAPPRTDPAPSVGDRPAYWLPGGTGAVIAWEWAPGAWGTVALTGPGVTDRAVAQRVAQSVLPQASRPVAVPFTVGPGVLGGRYRVVGVSGSYPGQGVPERTSLVYGTRDPSGPSADADRVEVGVLRPRPAATPGARIGGVPAAVSRDEIVLLPPGGAYAIFARAAREDTMRALVQAVTVTP
ncbi:hypothetical protein [Bailinhaonella thermotolerans]|uniref:Uncharacterized protein n=1 Tax=Bailinhaonella thermotolerans TaxID=1070861 RepID=A0A3A4BFI4_9ACTN|nr:hypothetical protein [Bailinhaonella thermotolerans]RJL33242.1 hypothetical protein D5H75_10465 [Bailinhaonella thermotolerans]